MAWPRGRPCPPEKRRRLSQQQRGQVRRGDILPRAAELYARGQSLAEVARAVGAAIDTTRRVLLAAGVVIRSAEETWAARRAPAAVPAPARRIGPVTARPGFGVE